jgi:ferredoxin-type protein NapH
MSKALGQQTKAKFGRLYTIKLLLLRRFSQLLVLFLFLLGPTFGVWFIEGNLSSSLFLDTVPLTDPYVLTQITFSGHWPEFNALLGVAIVICCYLLVGGRVFCSWVCPVNLITDLASYFRRTLRINTSTKLHKNLRQVILASTLLVPLIIGYVVWELINPVSLFHRGLIFGMGYGYLLLIAIFIFDLLVVRNGWCGHLCPMGAFYSHINRLGITKVKATEREQCDDCGDCYLICPEPHVLKPALKPNKSSDPKLITSQDCTNCGRCIDICHEKVFNYSTRFNKD